MSYINLATYASPIILDDKGLKSGLKKAEDDVKKSTSSISSFMKKGLAGGLAAVAGASAGLMALTSKSAEVTDNIDKMSQKIGISRQGFQEYSYILSQNGTDVDVLQRGFKTLTDRMDESIQGSGKGAEAFGKLGLSATDLEGNMKSQEEMFEESAKSLMKMPEGAEKSALAFDLFGKAGQELMPLLNGTEEGMDELRQSAHDMGLVLSDEAVDAGAEFTDAMDNVQRMLASVTTTVGVKLMPVIQSFLEWVMQYMPEIQATFSFVFGIMETLVTGFVDVIGFLIGWLQTWFSKNEETLTNMKESFMEYFEIVKGFFNGFVEFAKMIWDLFGENIMSVTRFIFDTISNIISSVFEVIKGVLQVFTGIFTRDWEMFGEGLHKIWDGLWKLIGTILNSAVELIKLAISNFIDIVQKLWTAFTDVLKNLWGSMWEGIKKIVAGAWNMLSGTFSNLFSDIKNWFTGLVKDGIQWGKDLITGFKDGIVAMAQAPVQAVQNMSKNISDSVKSFFGIHSPSKLMAEYGMNLSQGLAKGVEDERDKPINAVREISREMQQQATEAVRKINDTFSSIKVPSISSSKSSSSGSSGSRSSGGTKVSTSEREKYQADNREYSKNNSKEIDRISRDHGVDSGVARDMDKANKSSGTKIYHDGGWVNGNNVFAGRMGLMPDEVPAILQSGEYVLSRKMIKDISIPKKGAGGSSINTYQDDYNITLKVEGNLDRSILPEVERMITKGIDKAQASKINKYKDVGIRRPVY